MMLKRNDGAGVYTLGRQPGTVVRGNHIHDGGGSHLSGGVYLDEGSADIEVSGNLIYRIRRPLMFNNRKQNRRASCKVVDNVLAAPPATAPGVKGRALKGGTGIDVPHEPRLDPPQFTFTAWVRLDLHPTGKDARRWVVCKAAHEWTDHHLALFVDGRNVSAYLNIGGGKGNNHEAAGSGDPLPLDRWTPVAMTYDGDTLRVYCDAKEVGARQVGKSRAPGTAPLTFGARSDRFATFDCGDIDEVRLFNRALTAAEIGRADDLAEGLVEHWDFEQLSGQDASAEIAAAAGLEPAYRHLLETGP
jgi:hypothetical protein